MPSAVTTYITVRIATSRQEVSRSQVKNAATISATNGSMTPTSVDARSRCAPSVLRVFISAALLQVAGSYRVKASRLLSMVGWLRQRPRGYGIKYSTVLFDGPELSALSP